MANEANEVVCTIVAIRAHVPFGQRDETPRSFFVKLPPPFTVMAPSNEWLVGTPEKNTSVFARIRLQGSVFKEHSMSLVTPEWSDPGSFAVSTIQDSVVRGDIEIHCTREGMTFKILCRPRSIDGVVVLGRKFGTTIPAGTPMPPERPPVPVVPAEQHGRLSFPTLPPQPATPKPPTLAPKPKPVAPAPKLAVAKSEFVVPAIEFVAANAPVPAPRPIPAPAARWPQFPEKKVGTTPAVKPEPPPAKPLFRITAPPPKGKSFSVGPAPLKPGQRMVMVCDIVATGEQLHGRECKRDNIMVKRRDDGRWELVYNGPRVFRARVTGVQQIAVYIEE